MAYDKFRLPRLTLLVAGLLVCSISTHALGDSPTTPNSKPRLMVLTDITSTESGVREPDDAQTMIRLLLYANEFDIEGLIASSGLGHGHKVWPQNIRRIVDAYAKVRPNLLLHDQDYPSAERLRGMIKSGQPNAGRKTPVFESIGEGKETPASRWIIRMVDKPDPRPLWITAWGGTADLAQALWKVRSTRSDQELQRFLGKIRVMASSDQDTTGPWIKAQFPSLFYATRKGAGRGMYRGGNQRLVNSAWVQDNIKGHGALGELYPDYRGGDKWTYELGDQIRGIKSGDSSTYMGLIDNGLNIRNRLIWENWGGRLKRKDASNHYQDAIDRVGDYQTDVLPYLAAVYRWRADFQADYAARFDWCVEPYDQANHAPVHENSAPKIIEKGVAAGTTVKLSSGHWRDPDGNDLTFHWQMLEAESSYPERITVLKLLRQGGIYSNENTMTQHVAQSAQFTAPSVKQPQSIHILLTVKDDGSPALPAYQRFIVTVHP